MLNKSIDEEIKILKTLQTQSSYICRVFNQIFEHVISGGKIIWIGNGGSAVDSMHFSAELVGQYKYKRKPISSIALTANIAAITSIANDISYEMIFSRQLEAVVDEKDVVIMLSTSGKSKNISNALSWCKERDLYTVLITGETVSDSTIEKATEVISVCSQSTPRIQESYYLICHSLCEYLEEKMGE